MSLVKSREMREQEPRSESEPMLPCVKCQSTRKTTTLAFYGGMCEQCFGDYCRKPFPIPRRPA